MRLVSVSKDTEARDEHALHAYTLIIGILTALAIPKARTIARAILATLVPYSFCYSTEYLKGKLFVS